MIDLECQAIEFDLGLDEGVEGWLSLQFPKMAEHLEASRKHPNTHQHRQLCLRIVTAYRKENPAIIEWTGSELGPVFITTGVATAPNEIGLDELTKALSAGRPEPARTILRQLMLAKKTTGGVLTAVAGIG